LNNHTSCSKDGLFLLHWHLSCLNNGIFAVSILAFLPSQHNSPWSLACCSWVLAHFCMAAPPCWPCFQPNSTIAKPAWSLFLPYCTVASFAQLVLQPYCTAANWHSSTTTILRCCSSAQLYHQHFCTVAHQHSSTQPLCTVAL